MSAKQIHPGKLAETVASIREQGKTIATLNGSFDFAPCGALADHS